MSRKSLISEEDFRDINQKYSMRMSIKDIAKDYGVTYQVMYNTIKKRIPKWEQKKFTEEIQDTEQLASEKARTTLHEMADTAEKAMKQAKEEASEKMCKRYLLQRIQNLNLVCGKLERHQDEDANKSLQFAKDALTSYENGDFELCIDKTLRSFHYFQLAVVKIVG